MRQQKKTPNWATICNKIKMEVLKKILVNSYSKLCQNFGKIMTSIRVTFSNILRNPASNSYFE